MLILPKWVGPWSGGQKIEIGNVDIVVAIEVSFEPRMRFSSAVGIEVGGQSVEVCDVDVLVPVGGPFKGQ